MARAKLMGLRVLVVEDQMILAMEIGAMLADLGCEVVGPVGKLDAALRLAGDAALDAAILDVNLDGDTVSPVVQELQARGIPFILSTGYGASTLPDELRGLPALEKPFVADDLERLMRKTCVRS